ncbi:MAG: hypothetical protein H0U76_22320 [Ktedonobacteraceae bacterium]|nr:hypothetical protein [Ktedonobacteraceae bacterium]
MPVSDPINCTCTSGAARCEEGRRLLAEKERAWEAWTRVSGTPRAEYGFREDYQEAKAAYNEHMRKAS